jgi:hypothetical protein
VPYSAHVSHCSPDFTLPSQIPLIQIWLQSLVGFLCLWAFSLSLAFRRDVQTLVNKVVALAVSSIEEHSLVGTFQFQLGPLCCEDLTLCTSDLEIQLGSWRCTREVTELGLSRPRPQPNNAIMAQNKNNRLLPNLYSPKALIILPL